MSTVASKNICIQVLVLVVNGSAVGLGTALQARVRFLMGHWNFSLTKAFRPHYDSSVDSDS